VSHQEFPELTPETRAADEAGRSVAFVSLEIYDHRRYAAAFLQEAIEQAKSKNGILVVNKLLAIADNLHSPPPPPPTLTEARAADLDTPAGRRVVYTSLASLGEDGHP